MRLAHEQAYDAIMVKQTLLRATTARLTGHAHAAERVDPLEGEIRAGLRAGALLPASPSAATPEMVLRFSLPILERIGRFRERRERAERRPVSHEQLERAIAAQVADDLRRTRRSSAGAPTDLLAAHVAATFVRVVDWWLNGDMSLSARRVDDLFRALVLPQVTQALRA
ncbi:MAG: hypothetical protein HOQ09_04445 [Gemmatimonadaceae bacterium]|nr:hypothetical protein [Gemmatimonadaceae bacterium]